MVQMTHHARQRCAEMLIHTRTAKRIWQHRTLVMPDPQGHGDRVFVTSTVDPRYALVVADPHGKPKVVTVLLYDTEGYYERGGCPDWCTAEGSHWHDEVDRFPVGQQS